jgi:M6 family metalloprotease-like protein
MLQAKLICYFVSFRSRYCRLGLAALVGALLSLIIPAGAALAVPVAPDDVILTQPDGTVIIVSPFGDEYYSGYEYQGYTILHDEKSDYWVYARPTTGGGLAPGLQKAGIDAPPAVLSPHLRDSQAAARARLAMSTPLGPEVWPGVSGSHKVLIFLIDFTPTTSLGTTDAQWYATFFDNNPGVKSVKNYYEQASYGNFTMDPAAESYGTANDGVIDVTLPYANAYPWAGEAERTSVRDVLIAANPYVDYSTLDTNHNGSLDNLEVHLVLIVRGFEESYGGTGGACTPNVWGHRWSMPTGACAYCAPLLDGVTIGASAYNGGYTREGEWYETTSEGCTSANGHKATIGIMVHELGHDIRWPDTYDTDSSSEGVGNWDVMAGGSWGQASGDPYSGVTPVLPDPFLKGYQGWLTPVQVTAPAVNIAIPNSAQNATVYQLGANPNGIDWDYGTSSGTGEYFLVENRQQVGFDAGLYKIDNNARGCMIWHIDETRTSSNTANGNEARKLVDVEEADGPPQDLDFPAGSGGNRGDPGDPWPGSAGKTAFNAASNPNSNWYSGLASGLRVINISTDGTGCTVDFSEATWDGSANSNWNVASNWDVNVVPNATDDVVIPSGPPNWPDVNAAASAFNLHIQNGAHLNATAGVPLEVYGNWTEAGSGYFNANAGTVIFRGSAAQTITSGAGSHFNHLQIGSGSTSQTVTANSDLDVNGNFAAQPGAGLAMGSHTLRVGGNWTDNFMTFLPGSGSVILDGSAQTVDRTNNSGGVLNESFDEADGKAGFSTAYLPLGWVREQSVGSGFFGGDGNYCSSAGSAVKWNNSPDAWLFSTGVYLQPGVTYQLSYNYRTIFSGISQVWSMYIGQAQNSAAMTQVGTSATSSSTTCSPKTDTFTVATAGTYYVGIRAQNGSGSTYAVVDNVVLTGVQDLTFYNLSIAGSGAATLADNAAVQNNLSIDNLGALALGATNLTVEGSVANNGSLSQTRTVNGASTDFLNLKNRAGSVDKYLGVTLDPGGSNMGSTTVAIHGNQLCSGATVGVKRCFDLSPATPQTAAVTFYYTEAERNGTNNALMKVFHWGGSTWSQQAGAITRGGSGDGQWVRVAGISAYSPFALNNGAPTAVSMAGFSGAGLPDGSVSLEWHTVNELDLIGFRVYRAPAGSQTPQLLTPDLIPGQWPGSPAGGSYAFQDLTALPGAAYDYWIEAIQTGDVSERFGPLRVAVMPLGGFRIFLPLVADIP